MNGLLFYQLCAPDIIFQYEGGLSVTQFSPIFILTTPLGCVVLSCSAHIGSAFFDAVLQWLWVICALSS